MSVTAPVANAMSKFQANTSLTPRAVFAPPLGVEERVRVGEVRRWYTAVDESR